MLRAIVAPPQDPPGYPQTLRLIGVDHNQVLQGAEVTGGFCHSGFGKCSGLTAIGGTVEVESSRLEIDIVHVCRIDGDVAAIAAGEIGPVLAVRIRSPQGAV